MKKILLSTLTLLLVVACGKFDDSDIWSELRNHEERILKLETLCNQMNTNITSLQTIIIALQNNDYVTNITPIKEGSKEIGYTITFAKSGSITIYHGRDGENGKDGVNGTDAKDGYTPKIGVKQHTDGKYYWTLDGTWLLDDKGNMIPTTGEDGIDGSNGKDGQDGITPQLKIVDGYWFLSYDNGATWQKLGKATGNNGLDGAPGAAGVDGDSIIDSITQDDENVYLKLSDGTLITILKASRECVNLTLDAIDWSHVIFKGKVIERTVDLKITIYYGNHKDLTIYNCPNKTSIYDFEDDSFSILLESLKPNTTYYYFTEIVSHGQTCYKNIESFKTSQKPVVSGDYVDEYGINHGQGIEINGCIWAPVNCGYKAATENSKGYPYGKLYQWGRKYGQGYSLDYDETAIIWATSDLTLEELQTESSSLFMFTNWIPFSYNGNMWNNNTETEPQKSEYDPCPIGWRVSTREEFETLVTNGFMWGSDNEIVGGWFYMDENSHETAIFLPASGKANVRHRTVNHRQQEGYYLTSTKLGASAACYSIFENSGAWYMDGSMGGSVRCVRE